jgi:hypothetical protein
MRSAGVVQRLRELYWKKPEDDNNHPDLEVTLEAVAPLFVVLTSGTALSIFLLAVERCAYGRLHRQQQE